MQKEKVTEIEDGYAFELGRRESSMLLGFSENFPSERVKPHPTRRPPLQKAERAA